MKTRLKRFEQVERNRELVLAAARRVFLEKGYGAATVEEIAESAGFSRGVIYSQFEGKADLFMALLDARIAERAAQNARIAERSDGREAIVALLRRAEDDAAEEPGWALLLAEFRIQAARDPVLGARYAAAHRRTVDEMTAVIEGLQARTPNDAVVDPRHMAQLVLALHAGAALERAADPQAVPPKALLAAFLRLEGL